MAGLTTLAVAEEPKIQTPVPASPRGRVRRDAAWQTHHSAHQTQT